MARSPGCIRWPTCSGSAISEHDPEKCKPVFPRDKREAFARRSCSDNKSIAASRNKTEIKGMSDRLLVLVRHGQSEWNLKNLFTGWKDVDLTEQGVAEARAAGRKLKAQGLKFDVAYTSALKRANRTLDLILEEMGQTVP